MQQLEPDAEEGTPPSSPPRLMTRQDLRVVVLFHRELLFHAWHAARLEAAVGRLNARGTAAMADALAALLGLAGLCCDEEEQDNEEEQGESKEEEEDSDYVRVVLCLREAESRGGGAARHEEQEEDQKLLPPPPPPPPPPVVIKSEGGSKGAGAAAAVKEEDPETPPTPSPPLPLRLELRVLRYDAALDRLVARSVQAELELQVRCVRDSGMGDGTAAATPTNQLNRQYTTTCV